MATDTQSATADERPSGPAAAWILAVGLGTIVLGFLTSLVEASDRVKEWLTFDTGVGPLSGKTLITLSVFVVAGVLGTAALRNRNLPLKPVALVTLVLIFLGLLGTFPSFFQNVS